MSPACRSRLAGAVIIACTSGLHCSDDPGSDPDGKTPVQLRPGDLCNPPQPSNLKTRFLPSEVHFETCAGQACPTRKVELQVLPDVCAATPFTIEPTNVRVSAVASAFDLYAPSAAIDITAPDLQAGEYSVRARVPRGDGSDAEATLRVIVHDGPMDVPCVGNMTDESLAAGEVMEGMASLAGASIGLQAGADKPNEGSYQWSVAPFAASISCDDMSPPDGYIALGPAVTFGPNHKVFPREIPLSVPASPGRMPQNARLRHVEILYRSPGFPTPRTIPVSNVRFIKTQSGTWAASFMSPRLGSYQAVVRSEAGNKTRKRKLTHRAVMGVSMGGIGTSMFGTRHHDKFDVIAPLGGPGSWAWILDHIESNQLAGFRKIAKGTPLADIQLEKTECTDTAACKPDEVCIGRTSTRLGRCTFMASPKLPYEHNDTYNNWWAEYPRTGTGSAFPRQEYVKILRDLSLMFGNPVSENLAAGAESLPAGVPPTDASVTAGRQTEECSVWVDPIADDPNVASQEMLAAECPVQRCQNTLTLQNYFDDEFNPDGSFPVITVCDGTVPDEAQSPWANAWKADGDNRFPLEVALAVDYNANGRRDELEPIIRSGHEPYRDFGGDGVESSSEVGFVAGVNDDPAGDDYDPQFNPTGSENNHRWDPGEPFDDVGLDGVPGTKQQPPYPMGYRTPGDGYDVGEGDGQFTVSRGLQRFWDNDPSSLLSMRSEGPAGPLTEEALQRWDVWTDGGLRDIFNFHIAAHVFAGSLQGRAKSTSYFSDFSELPGLGSGDAASYSPSLIAWEDVPRSVFMRYGMIDPDTRAIETGNGQHVGTVDQIVSRLQTALYFVGQRWQEPELRSLVKNSAEDPAPDAPLCEVEGTCDFSFTSSEGRTGPVTINLPPGYGHREQQDRRYPVIYVLHGYGMSPKDLGIAILFVANWMNGTADNMRTRLPKAILVYVDGRCRGGPGGTAECIRGGFFANSARAKGFQNETWWLELMGHIDANYRTMGSSEVDWAD